MLRRSLVRAATNLRRVVSENTAQEAVLPKLDRSFSSALHHSFSFDHRNRSEDPDCRFNSVQSLDHIFRGFSTPEESSEAPSEQADAVSNSWQPLEAGGSGDLGPDAITQAAELASLGEAWDDCWIINRSFQWLIQSLHGASGTPWWASIAMATVLCRSAMFPIQIQQMKNLANMQRARPEMEQLNAWFNQKREMGQADQYKVEMTQRMGAVWKKYDCHPLKSLMPFFAQAPIFIGFFQALRAMAAAKVPSLTVGGLPFLWFQDLTVPDPYYTLPILSSLIFLLSVELNLADGMESQTGKAQSRMKNFMRVVALAIIPLAGSMPQGIFCYWITSNAFTLVQGAVLRMKRVKQALGLPIAAVANQGKAASVESIAAASPGRPVQTFAHAPAKGTSKTARQRRASGN